MSLDATRLPARASPRPPLVARQGQIRIAKVSDAERARAFAKARRHSALVRVLKIVLPILAVGAIGVLFITPTLLVNVVRPDLKAGLDAVEVTGDQLRMVNPRFEGETAEKGRYVVTAKAAVQTTGNLDQMHLEGVHGHIIEADKSWTDITAKAGIYETKKRTMTLSQGIVITSSANARAELDTADIDIDKKVVTSAVPVLLTLPNGTLKGKGLLIEADAKRFVLPDAVVAHLIPPKSPVMKPKAAAAPTGVLSATPAMSDGPIDVTAKRLDVLDGAKTANFTGAVEARQAGMTLTAEQLEIGYTGGNGANPLAAATVDGTAQTIRTATALKSVVITTADGRKATADKSVFDQQANSMTLMGAVVLSQGGSVLHADQVVADLTAHRTHVTAANRVNGHFVPVPKPEGEAAALAPAGLAALGSTGSPTDISANSLDLADDSGEAVFQGTVIVTQKGNRLSGERLAVDTNRRRMTMSGPGRVSGTFEGGATDGRSAKPKQSTGGFSTVSSGVGGNFTDLSASSGEPTSIEADNLIVEDDKGQATFTGKVVVVRGGNRIAAGTLTVFYAGGAAGSQLNKITAKDHVVIHAPGNQTASGDNLLYEPAKNQLLITGNVTVSQGGNIVNGQKLVVDLDTGESHFVTAAPPDGEVSQVPGAPKPGRISVMITPEGIKQMGGSGAATAQAPATTTTKKPKTGSIASDVLVAPN